MSLRLRNRRRRWWCRAEDRWRLRQVRLKLDGIGEDHGRFFTVAIRRMSAHLSTQRPKKIIHRDAKEIRTLLGHISDLETIVRFHGEEHGGEPLRERYERGAEGDANSASPLLRQLKLQTCTNALISRSLSLKDIILSAFHGPGVWILRRVDELRWWCSRRGWRWR